MKIIAYYLPQFHEIPENNKIWGDGFTEWTNVKKAKPLFKGHEQPVKPYNNNYYNLLDVSVMKWQADMAKKYGIYGFCFYHYWYNGHLLLEKPIENYLHDKSIDFPYCICWANHDWTTTWAQSDVRVIYRQNYNSEQDWDDHFDFLLPYLKDERYIKINGMPLVVIYDSTPSIKINKMIDRWQDLANRNGLGKIAFAHQSVVNDLVIGNDLSRYEYDIEYQPQYVRELFLKRPNRIMYTLRCYISRIYNAFDLMPRKKKKTKKETSSSLAVIRYEEVWNHIINMKPKRKNSIPGAFVRMDTTPRLKEKGFVTKGMTPDKLYYYLKKQIINCKEEYLSDYMFMFAWNEWAEGGYLEPDEKWGYKVLEAIKKALVDTDEFPYETRE